MAWNLTAQMVETCSCNMLCPCWFGVRELMVMDQGWCDSAFLFRIQEGNSDGVSLAGRTVVMAVDFPGPTLFDGNGTARLYIDSNANANQRRELESIFQGKKGGPMEVLAPMVSRWLPSQTARIDVKEEGDLLTASVGNFGQIRSQRLKNEAGQHTTMENAGLQAAFGLTRGYLAPSAGTQWSDADLPHRFAARSGMVGSVNWRGG